MAELDGQAVEVFARRLLDVFTGSGLTKLIGLGYRTGLFEAAARGPATSAELADRAGLDERYVREWLGAMVTGGFFEYEPTAGRYTFPTEHAALLTGPGARNAAPVSGLLESFGAVLPELERCFHSGGGVPYSAFRPQFTDHMDDVWRRIYDEHLQTGFLAAVPGLTERLTAGARVLDLGCGTGHAVNLMAQAYPGSTFVGYDIAADAIEAAEQERLATGVPNARFAVLDVTQLPATPPFDVITVFDAIHDQVAPDVVLRRIHDALRPDGLFVMVDFKFSSHLERNLANPFAPLHYAISVMHCMTVSLAEGGAGLGTVWGQELARKMLAEAGFGSVEVIDSPRPQNCIYISRRTSDETRDE
jgi:2-polyprenyl-3-methyl-5-hydroxy-6-metoxy-1,4-benzoquinol methylase